MIKRLISLLLVFVFTVQLPFLGYEKGKVYATGAVAGAAGAFTAAGASSAFWPAVVAALAVAGVCVGADKIADKIEDMTAEEQEEYYNTVAANNKEAIKKLYDDGYFANTGMEEVIGNMLSGDDTACAVSLKKVLKDKEMEEGKDIKTYESGKKDDNGKNKPLVAVSGKLMVLLVDVIGDAVGNMIKDKQSSSSGDYDDTLVKALPTVPTFSDYIRDVGSYSSRVKTGNYILFRSDTQFLCNRSYEGSHAPGYYIFWYNFTPRFEETYSTLAAPYGGWTVYMQGNNSNVVSVLYRYDEIENNWEMLSLNTGVGSSANYITFFNAEETFIKLFHNQDLNWEKTENSKTTRFVVPANPIPDMFDLQPPTTTEIVNNYFGDEITNFYEDVYNYTTNNSNNNYFTENKYLLPTDPADVAKDIIVPAETTINNTYNNISPDVTVDQDYINNIVIPAIISGINANLKLNTDVNMGDLTIDNLFDFSGDDLDDETFNKVTFHGLEKKFPFCLPFDVYYFLDALDAEPRAPAFTIVIPLHNFGFEDYPLKIDFSQFDPVFKVVRGCELFLACFGLVFVTKKMIWK